MVYSNGIVCFRFPRNNSSLIWSKKLKQIILNDLNNPNITTIMFDNFYFIDNKIKNDLCAARDNWKNYLYKVKNEYLIIYEILIKIISIIIFKLSKLPKNMYIAFEYIELLQYFKFDKIILYLHLINVINAKVENEYFQKVLFARRIQRKYRNYCKNKKIKALNILEQFFFRPNGLLTKIYLKRYTNEFIE